MGGLLAFLRVSQANPGPVIGFFAGFWMCLYSVADFALRPRSIYIAQTLDAYRYPSAALAQAFVFVIILGAVPMIVGAMWAGLDFRRVKVFFSIALLVCLSIALSYVHAIDVRGLSYLVLVASVFGYLMVGASANIDSEGFWRGLGLGVVICETAVMSVVLIDHDVQWGRLYGHNSANYWGMTAQGTILACLAIRNRPLQVVAIAVAVVTMCWCQSRGSMLATGVGLVAAIGVSTLTKRVSAWLWLFVPAALLIFGILGLDVVMDKLLLLSDPGRGLTSGFTGRTIAWRETLDLFYSHPLFGVGYRQNEQYLSTAIGAHNAYLATLADVGLFGAAAYLLLMCGGLVMAWRKALGGPTPGRLMAVAYLSAYLVNGLFERNALNVGNFYSVMAIVVCVWSWRANADRAPMTRPAAGPGPRSRRDRLTASFSPALRP
jgi:O-antigen ligase